MHKNKNGKVISDVVVQFNFKAWKSNLQNYCIQFITPIWLLHDLCEISEPPGSGTLTQPHYSDILVSSATVLLNHKTLAVLCGTKLGFAMSARHQPKAKMIRNDWKWPEKIGSDQERSGKVMWPRQHVAWSCDHLLMVRKYENTCLVSYGAHHCYYNRCWELALEYIHTL